MMDACIHTFVKVQEIMQIFDPSLEIGVQLFPANMFHRPLFNIVIHC